MSRSTKQQYRSMGAGVMKAWKTQVNRSLRRKPIEEDILPVKKVSDLWDSPKDGKPSRSNSSNDSRK